MCALKGLGGRLGLLCPRGGGEGGSVGPAWRGDSEGVGGRLRAP